MFLRSRVEGGGGWVIIPGRTFPSRFVVYHFRAYVVCQLSVEEKWHIIVYDRTVA